MKKSITYQYLKKIYYILQKTIFYIQHKFHTYLAKNKCTIEADFIVSIGKSCRPAHYLRGAGLRTCANPLDWMMNYSLETVIMLWKKRFTTFFSNREDILDMPIIEGIKPVRDIDTKMISLHSFKECMRDDIAYSHFLMTMTKRFERMDAFIQKSETVVFFCARTEPMSTFKNFLLEISNIYPNKHFVLINIYDTTAGNSIRALQINTYLKILQFSFEDKHVNGSDPNINPDFWKGNEHEWAQVIAHLSLSDRLKADTVDSLLEDKECQ